MRVLAIEPCPAIETGSQPVVTGQFRHSARELVTLEIAGLTTPLRCTPRHPFWSLTRGQFVPAADLQAGEELQTTNGDSAQVISVALTQEQSPVYNIEVQGEHVYRVSELGLLVHNARFGGDAPKSGIGSFSRASEFGIQSYGDLRKLTKGTGLQAHHLLEKRFANSLGVNPNSMKAIALTPAEHQAFTNTWRQAIPYGQGTTNATRQQIENAVRQFCRDYPDILRALDL